jgi:diacylglycerol kinase family enzyme
VATAGGRASEGVSVFVQNAQPYTYFRRRAISLAAGAGLQSGDLSGAVLTRANALDLPTIALRLLSRRAEIGGHPRVHAFDGLDGLRVRSADHRPVPVQVDGDYVGTHEEAVFGVLPGALRVVA